MEKRFTVGLWETEKVVSSEWARERCVDFQDRNPEWCLVVYLIKDEEDVKRNGYSAYLCKVRDLLKMVKLVQELVAY